MGRWRALQEERRVDMRRRKGARVRRQLQGGSRPGTANTGTGGRLGTSIDKSSIEQSIEQSELCLKRAHVSSRRELDAFLNEGNRRPIRPAGFKRKKEEGE